MYTWSNTPLVLLFESTQIDHSMDKGEELSQKINYDITSINYYSPILWFSFIPVIKNLLAERDASSENIVDDVILEAFKMNNGSIFNFFMKHHLQ